MRPRRLQIFPLLALLAGCSDDGGPGTTSDGTTAVTPTTGGCNTDDECPGFMCQRGVCDAGMCAMVPLAAGVEVDDRPGNCQHLVCDGQGQGTPLPADDDLPFDTSRDCKREVCQAGAPVFEVDDLDLPNDGNDCTTDTCKDGTPNFAPLPINSFCGPGGNSFCHDDGNCEPCKQITEACVDDSNSEPNESQVAARDLGGIDDDDASGGTFCGVLQGDDDVDWFKFTGNDVLFNYVDPTRQILTDGAARLCVYAQCKGGGTSVGCDGGTSKATAPLGQAGCCGEGTVAPSLDCDGLDDSATIWISVENVAALACVGYQLDYHF